MKKSAILLTIIVSLFMVNVATSDDGGHPFPFGDHPFPVGDHPFPMTVPAYFYNVVDGDSIQIQLEDEDVIRDVDLEGIDAMELDFEGHYQGEGALIARNLLAQKLPYLTPLTLAFEEIDRNQVSKKMRAYVFYYDRNVKKWLSINQLLLRTGWAVVHIEYPFTAKDETYRKLSRHAAKHHAGIFNLEYWQGSPYHFRLVSTRKSPRAWVGDVRTKEVVTPDNYYGLPLVERIYFKDLETAEKAGFKLSAKEH